MSRSFLMLRSHFLILVLLSTVGWGCAKSRTVTLSAIPADSMIRIDGRDRGRGPFPETFTFSGGVDSHTVQASREGYRAQQATITRDFDRESLVLTLKPEKRQVTFNVSPMPAILKLDGKTLSQIPVSDKSVYIEFEIGPSGKWNTHRVTAETDSFLPVSREIKFEDTDTVYELQLRPKRKSFQITSSPPDSDVYVDGKLIGKTPLARTDVDFPVDVETGKYASQKLRVEHPGYAPKESELSWDNGQLSYEITLQPLTKTVRFVTDPPGATVQIEGVEIKPEADGVPTIKGVPFDLNDKDEQKTYHATITKKKTADSEWEPSQIDIAWDNGQTDYPIKLKEILIRKVALNRVRITRAQDGWNFAGEAVSTLGVKDVTEGNDKNKPVRITAAKKKAAIDTFAISPDGGLLVFTTLSDTAGDLHSQIQIQATEGTPEPKVLSDGRSLDIMPSFTPDGSQIVFASNRAGRKLSIWSMSATDSPVPEELVGGNGESNDLWPTVDSSPKPRLFFQSLIDTRPDPRLFSTPLGAKKLKDLTASSGLAGGGTQPRVAPTADAVVFTAVDPKTNKRDIYRMSDAGGDAVNLTNTPNVDEFDPAWSSDGSKIAYVSARSAEAPDNLDISIIDASGASKPTFVTSNTSWDDCPAWDPSGRAIYFRSNRGGEWNIWRIDLK